MLHIVLVEPEIPQNTGNIARTVAATGCRLHLVRPLGFSTDDRYLKRAGLDYWPLVPVSYWDSFPELQAAFPERTFYYATTKGRRKYTDVTYGDGDFLVFGKETAGLPPELIRANLAYCIRIPMSAGTRDRSLNLSNAVAVVLYEALRQSGFAALD
ncbi:MAG: tRNA (cytidine(34)-2'-O)-methyltransferase [bacterium]|jgi:tRNA (cytidine/uridine-2'-O-)-methyltransferase